MFPLLSNIGKVSEINIYLDPVTSLFKLHRFGEDYDRKRSENAVQNFS